MEAGARLEAAAERGQGRRKDRADRATAEQVLDPRTRGLLLKLENAGVLGGLAGCISTGKEANVYRAWAPGGAGLAVKVYKTSILVFKDRDRYITGEFRFQQGYARHNPRKMVRLWAEKEFRNLTRLAAAGLPCPAPVLVRGHVLVMSLLAADDGEAAPRLKDAAGGLSPRRRDQAYEQCCGLLRAIYQQARLVHADFSEYNLLWARGTVYVIDVAQSVEEEHPHALEFLRMDCRNITDFFRRLGVAPLLPPRRLFHFIVEQLTGSPDERLHQLRVEAETAPEDPDEAVFEQIYLPRTLTEIVDWERQQERLQQGDIETALVHTVAGHNAGLVDFNDSNSDSDSSSYSDSVSDSEDHEEKSLRIKKTVLTPEEQAQLRSERKAKAKAVKQQARVRRETKPPKNSKKKQSRPPPRPARQPKSAD